ncbi:glucose-1-phosphate thymidylyltransferase RfbA [Acholeplasma sp. OttesenSCG-928-E16]|nr:glucose-1-phosphate thymidylyltransferase RfbA [Acholeplasma sp. OttesenSCG-928-E16]
MKGIILAGGSGTRLYPLTTVTSKQLLPIYDKPMIYYPLSILMLAKIKDILIISTKEDINRFKDLLKDGSLFGINLSYKVQPSPDGLAQAFILGDDFIGNDSVCMILGDNIFYGNGLVNELKKAVDSINNGFSTIFSYMVKEPNRFGVVEFDKDGKAISLEEKPMIPKSNYAVTGLYFYDNSVVERAKSLKPSKRNELEITDLNNLYLAEGKLKVITLGRGYTWLDTGTFESLYNASEFVKVVQENQGIKISCIEEIAYNNGWMSKSQLIERMKTYEKNSYGDYLKKVVEGGIKY